MEVHALVIFALVYGAAIAVPGPVVAALLAQTLIRGPRGAPAFAAGNLAADLVWFTATAAGLAALAQAAKEVFVTLKTVGAIYLIYLAYRLWTAPAQGVDIGASKPSQSNIRLFLASFILTMSNPKALVLFLALLPTVVDLGTLKVNGFLRIASVMCLVQPLVLGTYVLLAASARRLFKSPNAVRSLNRGSGIAMAGAAVVVTLR